MSVFDNYALYYDLLYRDKEYGLEAAFIHRQLVGSGAKIGNILEMGSGTGRHALELAALGWNVDGVDLSAKMVSEAQARGLTQTPELSRRVNFREGDVRSIKTGRTYDAVVSLFHVMSYQLTYGDLEAAIGNASDHLSVGGRYLFDFWYGPAVLSDPPALRVRQLEDEKVEVLRIATPTSSTDRNLVNIRYRILVKDRKTGSYSEFIEDHPLRYWFMPELDHFLGKGGFRILATGPCYSTDALGTNTWYGWVLATKTPLKGSH